MAGLGNPKLYARQKAKHLTLILLASLLLSVYVQAEVVDGFPLDRFQPTEPLSDLASQK